MISNIVYDHFETIVFTSKVVQWISNICSFYSYPIPIHDASFLVCLHGELLPEDFVHCLLSMFLFHSCAEI